MSYDEMLPRCEYRDATFSCGHPATKRDPRGPAYCARHWQQVDDDLARTPGNLVLQVLAHQEATMSPPGPIVDACIADFERQMAGR